MFELSSLQAYILVGSIVGFFFCVAFAQFAFIKGYWKFFVPFMILALLVAMTLGLIWIALIYTAAGATLGWLFRKLRRA